jgi:uncharacterized protein
LWLHGKYAEYGTGGGWSSLDISGEHRFAAPRSAVWEVLLDPQALRAALPGCESFTETEPERYDITLRVGIAAIRGTYSGTVAVRDQAAGKSYRLEIDGSGAAGKVTGEATVELAEDGGGTMVRYRSDVRAQGAIAKLGDRALAGSAKLLAGQFFKAMDKQVQQRVV